jgi:hypothetical protein
MFELCCTLCRTLPFALLPPLPSVPPFPPSCAPGIRTIHRRIRIGIPTSALLQNLTESVGIAQGAGVLKIKFHNLPILKAILRRPVVHWCAWVGPQLRARGKRH